MTVLHGVGDRVVQILFGKPGMIFLWCWPAEFQIFSKRFGGASEGTSGVIELADGARQIGIDWQSPGGGP